MLGALLVQFHSSFLPFLISTKFFYQEKKIWTDKMVHIFYPLNYTTGFLCPQNFYKVGGAAGVPPIKI